MKVCLVQVYFRKSFWCLFISNFEKSGLHQIRETGKIVGYSGCCVFTLDSVKSSIKQPFIFWLGGRLFHCYGKC